MSVNSPHFIFVGVADRRAFDRIDRPVLDLGPKQDGSHVLMKTVEEGEVWVIFQHWIVDPPRPTPTRIRFAAGSDVG